MDSTPNNESLSEILPKKLAAYLKANVSGLVETYGEFPSANQRMNLPALSVFTVRPDFRPLAPYTMPIDPDDVDENNQTTVKWVVGIWDYVLQLDLWARNKEERDDLHDAIFNALNPNISPMGLVLVMDEYFNQRCDYVYTGYEHQDSQEKSQRDEWRVTLNLLATCKAIRERQEFIITDPASAPEIEQAGQIDRTVVVPD